MATPHRPSPLSFDTSGRQSPFKRQNSTSPTKGNSLSLEKTSPFVRRPSQLSDTSSTRPSSPFARPTSGRELPTSPSKEGASHNDEGRERSATPFDTSRPSSATPRVDDIDDMAHVPTPSRPLPSPTPFDGSASPAVDSPSLPVPSPANLRPVAQRTMTNSTTSTIKQPNFGGAARPALPPLSTPTTNNKAIGGITGYNNLPQALLRSMRESFEVLDSSNSGAVTSASVASMLDQMGMDSTPSNVRDFFPPSAPAQLNLAKYLDVLSAPLSDLSQPDELMAAFGAFDVDDSGQIDVRELRNALVHTAPEASEGGVRLSERDIDRILGEFTGRRAFGAKGLNAGMGKGDVFRYRDFMAGINGGGMEPGGSEGTVGV